MPEPQQQPQGAPARQSEHADSMRRKDAHDPAQVPALLRYADFDYGSFLRRRNVRVLIAFVIVILALIFGYWLRAIFVPLLVGLAVAYILNPVVVWLQARGLSRFKSALTVFAAFVVISLGSMALVIPAILSNVNDFSKTGRDLPKKFDESAKSAVRAVNGVLPEDYRIDESSVTLTHLFESLLGTRSSNETAANGSATTPESPTANPASSPNAAQPPPRSTVASQALDAAPTAIELFQQSFSKLVALALFVVLVPFYTFYFMLGMDNIWAKVQAYLPGRQRDRIVKILREIHEMSSAFFRGRLTICLIVSALTISLFVIMKVPFGVVLGLLGGFGVIIPFFPILASLLPAVALMAVSGDHSGVEIGVMAGVFALIQGVEQFVLTPRILGQAVQLHPVTLLVGVFVMAEMMGVLGALLAVPLTAIAKILAREFILPYFKALAQEPPASDQSGRRPTETVKPAP